MTRTKASNPEARIYLGAVRRQLADVPWRQRDDLLATVRERLGELPETVAPARELGPPTEYARELRESAGLPNRDRHLLALVRATRLRTRLAAIASVVAIAVLVTALVARAHYQPISAVAMSGATNGRPITDNLVADTNFYRYEPGELVVSGIQIHNGGWARVSVDGVSIVGDPNGPLALVELRATSNDRLLGTWERAPEVSKLTVEPGRTVYLFVVMKMVTFALRPGDSQTIDQPQLRIRVLGVHHLVRVQGNKIGILAR